MADGEELSDAATAAWPVAMSMALDEVVGLLDQVIASPLDEIASTARNAALRVQRLAASFDERALQATPGSVGGDATLAADAEVLRVLAGWIGRAVDGDPAPDLGLAARGINQFGGLDEVWSLGEPVQIADAISALGVIALVSGHLNDAFLRGLQVLRQTFGPEHPQLEARYAAFIQFNNPQWETLTALHHYVGEPEARLRGARALRDFARDHSGDEAPPELVKGRPLPGDAALRSLVDMLILEKDPTRAAAIVDGIRWTVGLLEKRYKVLGLSREQARTIRKPYLREVSAFLGQNPDAPAAAPWRSAGGAVDQPVREALPAAVRPEPTADPRVRLVRQASMFANGSLAESAVDRHNRVVAKAYAAILKAWDNSSPGRGPYAVGAPGEDPGYAETAGMQLVSESRIALPGNGFDGRVAERLEVLLLCVLDPPQDLPRRPDGFPGVIAPDLVEGIVKGARAALGPLRRLAAVVAVDEVLKGLTARYPEVFSRIPAAGLSGADGFQGLS